MKILDNFASLLFCFHTFGVETFSVSRRALDPDLGWFSGSRASMERLTQQIKNTSGILNIFHRSDPEPQIRIRIRKPDPHPCFIYIG